MKRYGQQRPGALMIALGMIVTGTAYAQDDIAELGVLRVLGESNVPRTVLSEAPEALPTQTYVIGEHQIEAMPYARATISFAPRPA